MRLAVKKRQQPQTTALTNLEQPFLSIEKLINDFWRSWPFTSLSLLENTEASWWPKADIVETDKEYKVKLNIPGVDPSKVDIEVDDNTLVVSGQTEREEKEEGENWYRLERESGQFRRVFELPGGIEVDKVRAESKHGTLTVILPKVESAQKKKVTVEVKE